MGSLKVTGGKVGGYQVDVDLATYGGVEVNVWGSSHYNHDRVTLTMTPAEAEVLAADLVEHARQDRETAKSRRLAALVDGEQEL